MNTLFHFTFQAPRDRHLGLEYLTMTGQNTRVLEKYKLLGIRFCFGLVTRVFKSPKALNELLHKLLHKADVVERH